MIWPRVHNFSLSSIGQNHFDTIQCPIHISKHDESSWIFYLFLNVHNVHIFLNDSIPRSFFTFWKKTKCKFSTIVIQLFPSVTIRRSVVSFIYCTYSPFVCVCVAWVLNIMSEMKSTMNYCSSSSPIRERFSDVTNKKLQLNNIIDDDRRWKLFKGKQKHLCLLFRKN
jgi:hypothetical protein